MNTHASKFENLIKIGQLKTEAFIQSEFDGLKRSAKRKLIDSKNNALSTDSRFDLAYNAAHSLALAALRKQGYRSENRYVVFQLLELTVGLQPSTWRIFSLAHQKRNLAEYEGLSDIELSLIEALINATEKLNQAVEKLT